MHEADWQTETRNDRSRRSEQGRTRTKAPAMIARSDRLQHAAGVGVVSAFESFAKGCFHESDVCNGGGSVPRGRRDLDDLGRQRRSSGSRLPRLSRLLRLRLRRVLRMLWIPPSPRVPHVRRVRHVQRLRSARRNAGGNGAARSGRSAAQRFGAASEGARRLHADQGRLTAKPRFCAGSVRRLITQSRTVPAVFLRRRPPHACLSLPQSFTLLRQSLVVILLR